MTTQHLELLARSSAYELLSLAFLYPQQGSASALLEGARELETVSGPLGWGEFGQALQQLAGHLQGADDDALEAEYVAVFGHTISTDCPPYEAEYGQAHDFQKSQALADLNAFYAAFGVRVHPELKDRLDHISVELEFMHLLTLKEAYALQRGHGEDRALLCRQAQERFLASHLANWVMAFAGRLARKTRGQGFFGAVERLLSTHMDSEFRRAALEATPLAPVHAAEAPGEEVRCEAVP